MRKRLRKKLHLGEFKIEGLQVKAKLLGKYPGDAALDAFLLDIESHNLSCGGSFGSDGISTFFTRCSGECHRGGQCRDVTLQDGDATLVPQLMRKHFGPIELGEWSVEDSYHEDGYRKRRR